MLKRQLPFPAWVPHVAAAVFLIPVGMGLVGIAIPAFGVLPVFGYSDWSLVPLAQMLDQPGLGRAVLLSIWTGLSSTALALFAAIFLLCGLPLGRAQKRLITMLPWLATPHVSIAFGFAFLIAPSGWLARLLLCGFGSVDIPPNIITVRDPFGLSLIAGLALKETAFLVMVLVATLTRFDVDQRLSVAQMLGYRRQQAWLCVILPEAYGCIRLPLFAVLAYGIGNVDMALVLAPQTPPPLAVLVLRLLMHPDLSWQLTAAAGAILQIIVVGLGFLVWLCIERLIRTAARRWMLSGPAPHSKTRHQNDAGLCVFQGILLSILVVLFLWSVSLSWFFPNIFPSRLTTQTWENMTPTLLQSGAMTLLLAAVSAGVAVILVLMSLEIERLRPSAVGQILRKLCYIPLVVPQIAFLYGFQILLVTLRIDGTFGAVIWAHLIFVVPYVFLSLADPYMALDQRYNAVAASLGVSPWRRWWSVTLPLLKHPIGTAFALGMVVSMAQYLTTVFAGSGRIQTLGTEALALASGGNRRVVGVLGLTLAILPMLVFTGVLGLTYFARLTEWSKAIFPRSVENNL